MTTCTSTSGSHQKYGASYSLCKKLVARVSCVPRRLSSLSLTQSSVSAKASGIATGHSAISVYARSVASLYTGTDASQRSVMSEVTYWSDAFGSASESVSSARQSKAEKTRCETEITATKAMNNESGSVRRKLSPTREFHWFARFFCAATLLPLLAWQATPPGGSPAIGLDEVSRGLDEVSLIELLKRRAITTTGANRSAVKASTSFSTQIATKGSASITPNGTRPKTASWVASPPPPRHSASMPSSNSHSNVKNSSHPRAR